MVNSPKQFGKFLILSELSHGETASVYVAKYLKSIWGDRIVALKVANAMLVHDDQVLDEFCAEIKSATRFTHPNLATVLEAGEGHGLPFMAMEFVDGFDLAKFTKLITEKGMQLDVPTCCYLVMEVCNALIYLHEFYDSIQGEYTSIVHRNVSPQNILLSFTGDVKLIDFGIAKSTRNDEMTRIGFVKGTPGYLSPEQTESIPIDRRSDVFSLGVVFWELLTKKPFYGIEGDLDLMEKVKTVSAIPPSTHNALIPVELDNIVLCCLERVRDLRTQDARILHKSLHDYVVTSHPEFNPRAAFADWQKKLKSVISEIRMQRFSEVSTQGNLPESEGTKELTATATVTIANELPEQEEERMMASATEINFVKAAVVEAEKREADLLIEEKRVIEGQEAHNHSEAIPEPEKEKNSSVVPEMKSEVSKLNQDNPQNVNVDQPVVVANQSEENNGSKFFELNAQRKKLGKIKSFAQSNEPIVREKYSSSNLGLIVSGLAGLALLIYFGVNRVKSQKSPRGVSSQTSSEAPDRIVSESGEERIGYLEFDVESKLKFEVYINEVVIAPDSNGKYAAPLGKPLLVEIVSAGFEDFQFRPTLTKAEPSKRISLAFIPERPKGYLSLKVNNTYLISLYLEEKLVIENYGSLKNFPLPEGKYLAVVKDPKTEAVIHHEFTIAEGKTLVLK